MVLVKNINGTSDRTPNNFYSWKDYWMSVKGYWPSKCAAYRCNHSADVGGHVIKVNSLDKSWYIVPICYLHNNSGESFYVDESMLVPVR